MLSVGGIKVRLVLPEGFSLIEDDRFILLRYDGPGFHNLKETGGKKPSKWATYAALGAVNRKLRSGEARAFFRGLIGRVQAEIAAAS